MKIKTLKLKEVRAALKLVDLGQAGKANIANFTYRTKGTNEFSEFRVLLGVSLVKAYKRDLAVLKGMGKQINIHRAAARRQLILSIEESLEKGLGNNSDYKLIGLYENYNRGIKFRMVEPGKDEVAEILFTGYVIKKNIIEPGVYKKTFNSSPVTIEKKKLTKMLKRGRIRNFCFTGENLHLVSINGKKIAL